ncbi:peptidylprolyl isomerase [Echinicola vietnamensis]|uniref:Peptidyl-prolyl cis-trans isomerase n=1 Tax=Echinicola vietnamensis (strain DSM 17526 / LMG 23754 / KMM 6221) TaxID=926556 RepID=L0FZH8_ECHVK|nr:peptidylprolyl isomerase [Echinicola vietnamensis]AGA78010.1 peptidyl-prolyl cis-trans isomerase (rotamase) - cyclophilin family [Echinicola vietnamensis DSM 17526]
MKKYSLGLALLLSLLISCSSQKDSLIKIHTKHGDIYAILYDETPKHKENFIKLAEAGRFDSTEFHRVIDHFMVQGGDVFTKEGLPESKWCTIPAELDKGYLHEKGAIAAARQSDHVNPEKRSSGCQFYIVEGRKYTEEELTTNVKKLQKEFMKFISLESQRTLAEQYAALYEGGKYEEMTQLMLSKKEEMEEFLHINLSKEMDEAAIETFTTVGGTPHLDEGGYTVFGKVIHGMDVVEKISAVETAAMDRPVDPIYITVEVERVLKKKITKEYGFEYPEEK